MADCVKQVLEMDSETKKALFGDTEIPPKILGQLVQDLEDIKKGAELDPTLGSYQRRAMEWIAEKRELSKTELNMRAANISRKVTAWNFYNQEGFKGDYEEALRSRIDFSRGLVNGGRDSLYSRIAALKGRYGNMLFAGMEDAKVADLFWSGEIDREVHVALYHISEKKPVPKDIRPEAVKAAKVIDILNKKLFADIRDVGVPIRYMPGYITAQTHDIEKIGAMSFKDWESVVFPLLDKKRTFGTNSGDATAMSKQLLAIYKAIKAGSVGVDTVLSNKEIEDTIMQVGFTRSAAQKLSQNRFLQFKGPEEAFTYNQKFGNGTLGENIFYDINRRARMIAAISKFGTNPEAGLRSDIQMIINKLRKDGDLKQADQIGRQTDSIMNTYKEAMGTTSMPGQNTVARVGLFIRQLQALSKLGNAGIRSLSNIAVAAAELKSQTGRNILESHLDIVMDWFKAVPKENQAEYARQAAYVLTDLHETIMAAGGDIDPRAKPGLMAKSMQAMFKYTGLNMSTRNPKIAFGRLFMNTIAENVNKPFKELNPGLQATLLTAGISEGDFKVLKHAVETAADGRKFVTVEAIDNLDPKLVGDRVAEINSTIKNKNMHISARKYINELSQKYSGHLATSSDIVSTSASPRIKNIVNGGTLKGTVEGEVRGLLTQFKSFGVGAYFIGDKFLNSTPNLEALSRGQAVSEGFNNLKGKNYTTMVQFIVASTAIGYVTQALIDLANGKGVKDPSKSSTWLDAMAKSGAGGFYMDMLAGQNDRYSYAESVLGPTFGQAFGPGLKAMNLGRDAALEGNERKGTTAKMEAVKLIRNNVPFQSVPLIKWGVDQLHYDVINGYLRGPGFKARNASAKRRAEGSRTKFSVPNLIKGD